MMGVMVVVVVVAGAASSFPCSLLTRTNFRLNFCRLTLSNSPRVLSAISRPQFPTPHVFGPLRPQVHSIIASTNKPSQASSQEPASMLLRPVAAFLFSVSFFAACSNASEFTAATFPNPKTVKGFKDCNMRSVSNVCDPDQVFSESARYRANHELQQMVRRTERVTGSFCDRKGFEPLLLIAHEGDQQLADEINQLWNMDGQCRKAVIFFLSALDHALYYSSEPETGFDQADFVAIRTGQENYLAEGNYTFALSNIFKQIGGAKNIQVADEDNEEAYRDQQRKKAEKERSEAQNESPVSTTLFGVFAALLTYLVTL